MFYLFSNLRLKLNLSEKDAKLEKQTPYHLEYELIISSF